MVCPSCGNTNIDGAKFCMHCGTNLSALPVCPSCGSILPQGAKFCIKCGSQISSVEAVILPFISNGKVGLKDKNSGRIIANAIYDMVYGLHDGVYKFRKSGLYGFLNSEGYEIIPAKYKEANDFSEGLAGVSVDGSNWGFINTNDIFVLDAVYSWVMDFHEGLAFVEMEEEDMYLSESTFIGKLIDKKGAIISDYLYGSTYNCYREVAYTGEVVNDFHNGFAIMKDIRLYNGEETFISYYVLTKEGKKIPNPIQEYSHEASIKEYQKKNPDYDPDTAKYDDWGFEPHKGFKVAGDFGVFHNGVHKACMMSYCDTLEKVCEYGDTISSSVDGYGYLDLDNNIILPFNYAETHDLKCGRYRVKTKYDAKTDTGGKFGFLNEKLKLCIPYLYDDARDFSEGLAAVGIIDGSIKEGRCTYPRWKYGFIDSNGSCIIELKYSSVGDFCNGLALVKEQNGKAGFINKAGEMVIPPQFSSASNFSDGIAHIRIDKVRGFIDTFGNMMITDEELKDPWY